MIFDFRTFVGSSFDGLSQSVDELLTIMDSLEVNQALVCPFKPLSYDLDQANQNLAREIQPHSDRLMGAVRVDPWQPRAAESLNRGFEFLGLKALYLNPWEETFRVDIDHLDVLMSIASKGKIPVLLAAGYPWLSEALQVRKLAARWLDVPIIMSNGGQINISGLGQADATLALRQQDNLYIDTAGVYRQDFLEETVDEFGGERVLFGSGAPYFDQRYEIRRLQLARVSEEDRRKMAADNALRLLRLYSS
jgi:predicted TIM-barrel fold metal-dependent hydrolase